MAMSETFLSSEHRTTPPAAARWQDGPRRRPTTRAETSAHDVAAMAVANPNFIAEERALYEVVRAQVAARNIEPV